MSTLMEDPEDIKSLEVILRVREKKGVNEGLGVMKKWSSEAVSNNT